MDVKSTASEAVDTYSYSDEQDVLLEMKERLDDCWMDWDRIYRKSLECCDMIAGNIFRYDIKAQRIAEGRPVIEVNQLTQYTERVLGDMRHNLPAIKFRATTPNVAGKAVGEKTKAEYEMTEIYASIVKGIEQKSNAELWYDRASVQMVHGGVGWLRCYPCYKSEESLDLDIKISGVTDFTNAILDMTGLEPDFSDARYGFVFEQIPRKEFEARWPDASAISISRREYAGRLWFTEDMVTVAEYFERVAVPVTICRLTTGEIVEKDDEDDLMPKYPPEMIVQERKTMKHKVVWRKVTETDILEGGHKGIELPFREIPLIAMVGRESLSAQGRNFESLIVHAMDAQREACYWRTMMTEQVALQPKAKWTASAAQVESRRDDWERANTTPLDVLIYDIDPLNPTGQPQRIQPQQINAADMQQYITSVQDMKACIGLYDSAIGNLSGEVSGKAILARERQTDIGTYVYVHHRNEAVKRLGRLVLQGIKAIYTDTQTIRLFLPDETTDFVEINKAVPVEDEQGKRVEIENDVTEGEFDVYVDAGPAYNTLRIEAVNSLMEMAQTNPEIMSIAGDIMAMNMDWPGAMQFAERLKRATFAQNPNVFSSVELQELQKEQANNPPPAPNPDMQLQAGIADANSQKEQAKAARAAAEAEKAAQQAEQAKAEVVSGQASIDLQEQVKAMAAQAIADYIRETSGNTP